jgi:hypothetical protein
MYFNQEPKKSQTQFTISSERASFTNGSAHFTPDVLGKLKESFKKLSF